MKGKKEQVNVDFTKEKEWKEGRKGEKGKLGMLVQACDPTLGEWKLTLDPWGLLDSLA